MLKNSLIKQVYFSYRNYLIIFVLKWDVFKLIKNLCMKIKKQLMLTWLTCNVANLLTQLI